MLTGDSPVVRITEVAESARERERTRRKEEARFRLHAQWGDVLVIELKRAGETAGLDELHQISGWT
jgi:hypothetical protein